MFYICEMETIKIYLTNGLVICRSGFSICEVDYCGDDNFRYFKIDSEILKVTKREIEKIENG